MPIAESLDELIAKKALEFADQIKAAAAMADKEEEIRIETEKQLAFIQKAASIKLEGKHEVTVASGRVDSVYSRVIIEYKNPKSPGSRIGPKANSPGSKKVVEQIKKRFYDMRHEHGQPLNSLLGVGLDGNYFIFVRFRNEKWDVQEPVEVNRVSAERFLWALFNLGSKGKAFSPEYLAGDFGSEGGNTIAIDGIHALYDAILSTDNPKAQTFFGQWKILFGEVCGYDVDNPSDKIKKLAEFYNVGVKDPKPAELLFAVHTYYALFMKLLAAEIVAFFHKLPTPLQKMMQAATSKKLKREMDELEAGSIFRHLNISNFLEGDLFAWYTGVWTEPIERLVREMVMRLDDYNPGTLSEDPSGSRDLLKKLYQQLFPKSVRHDLGEYYTPDWLAEHVLDELGYTGDPDKRLLDPACGSGTFLVMAINRIRHWYDDNRERCRFDEGDLGRKILANVIGFDLNPLAVMAARTNYLIAIRDLIGRMDKVEIPVYLCDSIITPGEYGDLFTTQYGNTMELKTAAARFLIPSEIIGARDEVARYTEHLEFCVRNGYSPEEFVRRCQDDGLPVNAEILHGDLYRELVNLDKENKNGVWARIIKNAFAPIFTEPVDYVVGNPPWVRWSYLPPEYRQASWNLWDNYGLFQAKGHNAKINAGELDISMLFAYAALDKYVIEGGSLGFVITSEVWRSKVAGLGFRRFRIGKSGSEFKVTVVHDFVAIKPFEGVANKTSTFVAIKGRKHLYPVPVYRYERLPAAERLAETDSWLEWKENLKVTVLNAIPIGDALSPWKIGAITARRSPKSLSGSSSYTARCGARVDPYGIYFLQPLRIDSKYVHVRNMPELGKREIPQVEARLEKALVYPALRGRDIKRWIAIPQLLTIMPNRGINAADFMTYEEMKKNYPYTYAYFHLFWDVLAGKEDYWTYFAQLVEEASDAVLEKRYLHWRRINKARSGGVRRLVQASNVPLYSISKIGPYTFQPYRVVWPRMADDLRAAVISDFSVTVGRDCMPAKTVIPNDVMTLVGFDSEDEAHYFCACMNSTLVREHLLSFSSPGRGFGSPSILKNINIPEYVRARAEMIHLSQLSKKCHKAALDADVGTIESSERIIDDQVWKLWSL